MDGDRRLRLEIKGAVQGVGFRPFVYRLALELELRGWVVNDSGGVRIEVEGPGREVERFLDRLPREVPPRAVVHAIESSWHEPCGDCDFRIEKSDGGGAKIAFVLPDIATCADCLAEVLDAGDRRHLYPFTNCTNCGPRFTIIRALPYDRPSTTMERFVMCPDCQHEYQDPLDRRFHAQPNACPRCGPRLELRDSSGVAVATGSESLRQAAEAVRSGRILALKGLGGFLLVVDSGNDEAVVRLRRRKRRYEKPLALMVPDLAAARALCVVDAADEELLASPEAPIVLLERRPDAGVAAGVAPGHPDLGLMLPYTPLHHLLLRQVARPVVATSGNLSDEPIAIGNREAGERLGSVADLFLVHDRPIARHVDDSVVRSLGGAPQIVRRARGYAPLPVTSRLPAPLRGDGAALTEPMPAVLAVGGHLKNAVALSVGDQVFISQHLGDMETLETRAAFARTIRDFLDLYEVVPEAIVHDLHPDYPSTHWARAAAEGKAGERWTEALAGARLLGVQHHHAHLASCLAENGARGPALGVTWDGTGYGTDGLIWGGEFLHGDAGGFERPVSLRPFGLPGGDAAAREPRRSALAILWELEGEQALERSDLAPVASFTEVERRVLKGMLARRLRTPETTSAGRLFDAVASLLDLHQRTSFEGQAAMALEAVVDGGVDGAYPLSLRRGSAAPQKPRFQRGLRPSPSSSGADALRASTPESEPSATAGGESMRNSLLAPRELDWRPLIEAILEDRRRGVAVGVISARFHNALAEAIVAVALEVGEATVALTGGCFLNRRLSEHTSRLLERAGFEVLLQRRVPPGDGGISLGQVAVAAARLAS